MKPMKPLLSASLMLSVLAPMSALAAVNTWTNASGDFRWNNDDLAAEGRNWTLISPSPVDSSPQPIWIDGDDAVFGAAGVGAISVDTSNGVRNLTVNAAGYSFSGPNSGSALVFTGTTPTLTVNADINLGVRFEGTDGLTFQGTSPITLTRRNSYTGTTNILNGTVILNASGTTSGGSFGSHAIGGDNSATVINVSNGATLKYFNALNPVGPENLRAPNGQLQNQVTLNLAAGATYDLAGDDNQNNMPVPEGLGTVTNSSPYARAVLKIGILAPNTTKTVGAVLQDGGPLITSVVSGKTGYRLDVDFQSGNSDGNVVEFTGANTYTGSTRNANGTIRFSGAGKWGTPVNTGVPATSSPANTIICSSGSTELRFDLNGTNQITGSIVGTGGVFANNAAGTNSTLIVGGANFTTPYGTIGQGLTNNTSNSNTQNPWPNSGGAPTMVNGWLTNGTNNGKITDNTTFTGGKMALTKVGTGTIIFNTAASDYSGPTTIYEGILRFTSVAAPSPKSSIRIFTPGVLQLDHAGTKNVNALYINGVKQAAGGPYSASTHPGFITGSGEVTVVEVNPDETPVLSISTGATTATVIWTGFGMLQESTDLVTWTDLPNASTPYTAPLAGPKRFYRLR
jgi:fibronectin-binding autotransporter adhesin